jgi:predicted phosphodiesterase
MRYAIVSDLHANRQAWEAVLADAGAREVDAFICLGDVVGYGPMPLWLLNDVRQRCAAVVIGNHDAAACGRMDASIFNDEARAVVEWTRERIDDEGLRFLAGLPAAVEDDEVLYVHAEVEYPERFDYIVDAQNAAENLSACQHRLIFYGHTHTPMVFVERPDGVVHECATANFRAAEGCRYLINVGSVGEPRDPVNLTGRYAIYDSEEMEVEFCEVEFDKTAYRVDLDREGLPVVPYFLQMHEARLEGVEATRKLSLSAEPRAMRLLPISQLKDSAAAAARPSRLIVPLRDGSQQKRPGQTTVNLGPITSISSGASAGSSKGGAGKWIAAVLFLALMGGVGWWFLRDPASDESVDIELKLASEGGERLIEDESPAAGAEAGNDVARTTATAAVPPEPPRPMPAALLSYFPFEKNFNATLGSLKPKPTKVGQARLAAARSGKGLHLDAASSVRLGGKNNYGIDEDGLTVSVWYQMGGKDGDRRILMGNLPADASGGPGWQIVVSRVSAMLMVTDGTETAKVTQTLDLKMPEDQKIGWRHLVAVVDVRRGELRLHLNAKEPSIAELKSVAIDKLIAQRGLTLGADKKLPAPLKFSGKMDDLGIWNRALTPADVERIRVALNKDKKALDTLLNAKQPAPAVAKPPAAKPAAEKK